MSRRNFLKVTGVAGGAVAAGALLGGGGETILRALAPAPPTPESVTLAEQWVPNVCQQCPAGCGIIVKVVDGRAVKVEGNPAHPISMGRICPKGQASLQVLYDPDRIRGPLKRVGERGAGQWQQITWDQAISEVAEKLKALREAGEPHSLVWMSGRNQGYMGSWMGRFLSAYGSPNDIGHSTICADGTKWGHYFLQGKDDYLGYDWANCRYLLCFGAAFVEAFRPTVYLLRMFGQMRRGGPVRAKIVQVDTRFSITAAKADEWVSINPGTDGALALAIAWVIVSEKLYNVDFLRKRTDAPHLLDETTHQPLTDASGKKYYVWDEGANAPALWDPATLAYDPPLAKPALTGEYEVDIEGVKHKAKTVLTMWKELVLDKMTPADAAKITGVEEGRIWRLAQEFASARPSIATGERGVSMQPHGSFGRQAVHALNGLVGSVGVVGGVLVQRGPTLKSLSSVHPVKQDDIAKAGVKQPFIDERKTEKFPLAKNVYHHIPDVVMEGKPYPAKALFTYYTNPMFSTPNNGRWKEAIKKLELVVTFSPFMDETSMHADYILPDHTYLERMLDVPIYPSTGYPVVGFRRPVVPPLYDTIATGDVLIRLAKAIGGTVAESFPFEKFEDVLKIVYTGLFETKKGSIVKETFDEWWAEFNAKGVWYDSSTASFKFEDWKKELLTDSVKFEFFSVKLEHKLMDIAKKKDPGDPHKALEEMLTAYRIEAREPKVWFPHYEPFRTVGDPTAYPLLLNTYKLMTHGEGRTANQPWLWEVASVHLADAGRGLAIWDSWVEINPRTAENFGIEHGGMVWVESQFGRVKARAILFEGARPDVVNMPFDGGHTGYGRWAKGRGANPNEILAPEFEPLSGSASFFNTRVKVYPAGGD